MSGTRPDQRARLRTLLGGVFVALLAAGLTLAWLGYRQLRYEAFYLQQSLAAELTGRIDRAAVELFAREDARSFADFSFLIVGEGNFVQRSPLSAYPVKADLPGLVSYFQVDAEGAFSTPLLPSETLGRPEELEDYAGRLNLQDRVRALLAAEQAESRDDLDAGKRLAEVAAEPAPAPRLELEKEEAAEADEYLASPAVRRTANDSRLEAATAAAVDERRQLEQVQGQRAFDRLNAPRPVEESGGALGSVSELKLSETFPNRDFVPASPSSTSSTTLEPRIREAAEEIESRGRRAERSVAPESLADGELVASEAPAAELADAPFTLFESEVDPFRFDRLDDGHFVLQRTAWRDDRRFVQGAVVAREPFLEALIGRLYREAGLATDTLVVAHRGDVLATYVGARAGAYPYRASDITGTLLYRSRLTAPVNDLELVFGFDDLAVGPGANVIAGTTVLYLLLLVGGFLLIYRVGLRQIELGEQQQDFVSAVSHELKTPLTSIRMYGEMLKAGWVSEEKRREYYDYIFSESERLTRLINNVLRLARLDRNGTALDMKSCSVDELRDLARSKITSQVNQAGFELEERHEAADGLVRVDTDAFVQVLINLTDNALKFSRDADQKKVVFSSRVDGGDVVFSVRDFGPGVPREQMRKIFELFYRTERELTRETVGTGIGLALVNELITEMGGSVDVRNAEPGAEFLVRLPLSGAKNAAKA